MNEMIQWSPGVTLEQIEKQVIMKAYQFYHGNKTQTANSLGIAIRTLDNRLEKYAQDTVEEVKRYERQQQDRAAFLEKQRNGHGTSSVSGNSVSATAKVAAPLLSNNAHAGVRVESIANSVSQQAVPVSERQEVQKVLPKQTSKSDSKKAR